MGKAPSDHSLNEETGATCQGNSLAEHIRQRLQDFRRKLLDPSLRNPLLSFSHREPSTAFVRVIDEFPDLVFDRIEDDGDFVIGALDPPRTEPEDEETGSYQEALARLKAEEDAVYREALEALRRQGAGRTALADLVRRARDRVRFQLGMEPWEAETGLSPDELARRRGINPEFDLAEADPTAALEHHYDDALPTLLFEDRLDAKLRGLRDRARSSLQPQDGRDRPQMAVPSKHLKDAGDMR